MHVVVLGGGVIGVTSAYYLARQGAQVTLVERRPDVALETSYGNAGQVSPGYSTPWAAPGIPIKALKWMFQRHAPLSIRPDGSLYQWRWITRMLRECSAERYAINKERMLRLAEYSRDCLRSLRHDTGIQYASRTQGLMQLFRDPAQMQAAQRDTAVLEACGVAYELISRDQLAAVEPGLRHSLDKLAGGLRLPHDETGDCHRFTRALAALAADLGVVFRTGETVRGMVLEGGRITGVRLGETVLQADRYVAAFGSYTRDFLAPLRLDLPVYPVKGYSLTMPVIDEAAAPVSTVLDETYKVAVTRLGDRIRVGGMAELAGYDLALNPRRRQTLERVVNDLYPGSADLAQGEFWTGLRPMTPDGTPIVGRTRHENLYLNTGHGTLGWTMACGSGRVLADQLMGRTPEISVEGLDVSRYDTPSTRRPSATPAGTRVSA